MSITVRPDFWEGRGGRTGPLVPNMNRPSRAGLFPGGRRVFRRWDQGYGDPGYIVG